MSGVSTRIIDFFFPPQCLHCRKEGAWLCSGAKKNIDAIPLVIEPFRLRPIDRVVCRGPYDHPLLSSIVQRIKYDYWTGLSVLLPSLLTPVISAIPVQKISTAIVPVPLHWHRRLTRGFNQSDYLAQSLSHLTGFPVVHLLHRQRHTTPQANLGERERLTNVTRAFTPRTNIKIPQRVLLVDDVITTGSTISACASVLRVIGVQQIVAVGLAKG